MTYDPIDTNDDGVVDADVDNQSVSTGELPPNLTMVVVGDTHWGSDAGEDRTYRGVVPTDTLKSNLDDIIDHANAIDADMLVLMGDLVHSPDLTLSTATQYTADHLNYVRNTGGSAGNGFSGEVQVCIGNHDGYSFADQDLSAYYSNGLGYDNGLEDTFRLIERNGIQLGFINNAYSTTPRSTNISDHEVPDSDDPVNELDWIKNELTTTTDNGGSLDPTKPFFSFQHIPVVTGSGTKYDQFLHQEEVAEALASVDNHMAGFFGHVHHDPSWKRLRAQNNDDTKYLHFPTPNNFGITHDETIQPYGVVRCYADGRYHVRASYTKGETGHQSAWNDQSDPAIRPAKKMWEFDTTPDIYRWPPTSDLDITENGGSVVESQANGYARFQTGASSGNSVSAVKKVAQPTIGGTWNDSTLAFRTRVQFTSATNQHGHLLWGGEGTSEHFGFKFVDGGFIPTVGDGSTENDDGGAVMKNFGSGDNPLLEAQLVPGERAAFKIGGDEVAVLTSNLPSGNSWVSTQVNLAIETTAAEDKRMTISEWKPFVGYQTPYLETMNRKA